MELKNGFQLNKILGAILTCILILATSFAASAIFAPVKLGLAALPEGATAGKLYGVGILTGIGFTMSLFIGTLAFDDENILTQLRLAVLIASLASGLAGALWLSVARGRD